MGEQPYQGLRVADFTQGVAGSLSGRLLAEYGATVIHVESITRVDITRLTLPYKDGLPGVNRGLMFSNYHAGKYSVSLNMEHPRARDVANKLFAWADVILDSRVSGVMEKWGFGYDDVVKIRPDVIMVRVSNQGQSGPYAKHRGYGFHVMGQAGFCNTLGWADREPLMAGLGMYADSVAGRLAAVVVLAALSHRQRTGEGQLLDISMVEAGINFLLPQVLDYRVNGRDMHMMGNDSPCAAPHGAYPCRGDDSWCAIAVFSDEQWKRLCEVMGNAALAQEAKFSTVSARKENEEELERLVSKWTRGRSSEEVMTVLQRAGVPAGMVKSIPELCEDPQLRHRKHFLKLHHLECQQLYVDSFSFRLSETPSRPDAAVPCLGQHNEHIYCDILGISDDDFVTLLSDGVFE